MTKVKRVKLTVKQQTAIGWPVEVYNPQTADKMGTGYHFVFIDGNQDFWIIPDNNQPLVPNFYDLKPTGDSMLFVIPWRVQ